MEGRDSDDVVCLMGDGGAMMPMMGRILPRHGGMEGRDVDRGRNGGAVMPMMRWVLWLRDGGAVMPMMGGVLPRHGGAAMPIVLGA